MFADASWINTIKMNLILIMIMLYEMAIYSHCWTSMFSLRSRNNICKFGDEDGNKMIELVNAIRLNASLNALKKSKRLTNSAELFAWEQVLMISKGLDSIYPPHIGLNFSTPRTRIQSNGFNGIAWGENEVVTATTNIKVAEELLELDSENKKNLMGDYDRIGIGFALISCNNIPLNKSLIKIRNLCRMLKVLPKHKRYIHVVIQLLSKEELNLRDESLMINNCLNITESKSVSKHHYVLKPYAEQDINGSLNITKLLKQAKQIIPFIPPSRLLKEISLLIGSDRVNSSNQLDSRNISSSIVTKPINVKQIVSTYQPRYIIPNTTFSTNSSD